MPNLSNIEKLKKFKLLQIGESGSGKTTRALTATRFGKIFVFDLDEKLTELAPKIELETRKLVDFDNFKTYEDVIQKVSELEKTLASGTCPYATVIVDTWSRFHDLAMDKQKLINPRRKKFEYEDWGAVKNYNREFLDRIRSLPCNIIVNTHIGMKESASGKVVLTVGTSGGFGREMPQRFQETHFLDYDLGKYRVAGQQRSNIPANTGLPKKFYDNKGFFFSSTLDIFDETAYRRSS